MKRYVLGFMFNAAGATLVLIKKNKPKWQAGLWNGVGGKIEEGESPAYAMVREFQEETGLETVQTDWKPVALMRHRDPGAWPPKLEDFEVHVFACAGQNITAVHTATDEVVIVRRVDASLMDYNMVPNLKWLIWLAREALFEKQIRTTLIEYGELSVDEKHERKYVAEGGLTCPVCGSDAVEGAGYVEVNGVGCTNEVKCLDCRSEWLDEFKLSGLTITRKRPTEAT